MSSTIYLQWKYRKYRKNIKDYTAIEMLGSGAFGKVFKVKNNKTNEICVAKCLYCQNIPKEKIYREIENLIISKCPTIIEFLGYSLHDFNGKENIVIFMKYAEFGSLKKLLDLCKSGLTPPEYDNTIRQKILISISHSMKYLNQRRIIHRDLKSANVLLDKDFNAYLADFGFSKRIKIGEDFNQSQYCGTLIYMAPEIDQKMHYDYKVDVYAFGILMYEIVTGEDPYPELENKNIDIEEFIQKVKENNYRPKFDDMVKKSIKNLILSCLSNDPNERPSFDEIFNKLSYKIYESGDENEDNDYFLPDVDEYEIEDHVEMLEKNETLKDEPSNQIISELINKIIVNENEINKLKEENKKLNDSVNDLLIHMKTNPQFNAENVSLEQLLKKHDFSIELFNSSLLFDQFKMITIIFEAEQKNIHIANIKILIEYLLKIIPADYNNCLEIVIADSKEIIQILSNLVEILFLQNIFDSPEFIFILQKFCCISIEIKYPSENAAKIYDKLLYLKNSVTQLEISLHLTEYSKINLQGINENIKSIKYGENLTTINPFNKKYGSYNYSVIDHVFIPLSITTIGENAFSHFFRLEQINIPSSVTKIDKNAFADCCNLTKINIPKSVNSIDAAAFYNCIQLKQIDIPDSVTFLGCQCFSQCFSLIQVSLPSSIDEILPGTFFCCVSLKKIVIPPSVTFIDDYAFRNCRLLEEVTNLTDKIKLGRQVFSGCPLLKHLPSY